MECEDCESENTKFYETDEDGNTWWKCEDCGHVFADELPED